MIEYRDAAEIAQFLLRIFGEEARDIAVSRMDKSEQSEDWRAVLSEIEARLDQRRVSSAD
jgi:hypothetical protein